MRESTVISLPKKMPLVERITEANRKISEWISTLEKPLNDEKDDIQLEKYKQDHKEYTCHYIIVRDVKNLRKKK
jgi:hypothetical protein